MADAKKIHKIVHKSSMSPGPLYWGYRIPRNILYVTFSVSSGRNSNSAGAGADEKTTRFENRRDDSALMLEKKNL